jgi:hypothetical protein
MNPTPRSFRGALRASLSSAALLMGGCASLAPASLPLGAPIAQARGALTKPTGEYPLANGGTRLEFAQGSFGKQTYMLDFDRGGQLVAKTQVLTEDNFATIAPGLSEHDLLMTLGRPAQVFNVPWQKLHVMNYRYFGGDCVWFQVSVSDVTRSVTDAGTGYDPSCDGPNSKN